tara:strand:- start:1925 stop:2122 length:198 start_codon:yes stop_codon:yes gene_type:complete
MGMFVNTLHAFNIVSYTYRMYSNMDLDKKIIECDYGFKGVVKMLGVDRAYLRTKLSSPDIFKKNL